MEALPFDAPYGLSFHQLPNAEQLSLSTDIRQASYWWGVLQELGILVLEDRHKLLARPAGWADQERQLFIYDCSGIDLPEEDWRAEGQNLTQYKGYPIYHLQDSASQSVVVAAYRNLLLLSHQSVLIEDALRELTDQNRSAMQQARHPAQWPELAAKPVAASYFHFPYADPFFQEQTQQGISYLKSLSFEGWRIDWTDSSDRSTIFTAEAFWEEGKQLAAAKRTGLRMGQALAIIPAWAEDWELLQFRDLQAQHRQLKVGGTDWWSRYIFPWAGDHIGWVDLMPTADALSLAWLVPCRDSLLAQQSLDALLAEAGELNREQYQTFQLVQVNVENLFGAWRRGSELIQNPWWCKIADYYVFAADQQGLRQLIDAYIVGQNLLQLSLPDEWLQLETQWLRGLPCPPSWQSLLPAGSQSLWLSGQPTRKSWQIRAFPATPAEGLPKGPTVLWRSQLRNDLDLAPAIIAGGEGQWTVLATDRSGTLYRFSQDGNQIWRKQLEGQRLSDIQALPRITAKGTSIVLNTTTNLYQIKEDGSNVNNFPIRLQPSATAGVLAVDFQKEGIYEFFLPCQNGIYAFAEEGVPLNNWNPLVVPGRFSQSLRHLQDPTSDYLVAMNTAGVLYNWKRSGEEHFAPLQLPVSTNPLGIQRELTPLRVATVDKRGVVQVVNMSGEQFGLPLAVGSDSTVQFCAGNFIADARMDFLTLNEDGLQLNYYSDKGFEKAFQRQLDDRPDQVFCVPIKGQRHDLIGSLHRAKEEIRLYNGKGELLPGFPLAGSTPFRLHPLGRAGEYVLVVGQADWLLAYRVQL